MPQVYKHPYRKKWHIDVVGKGEFLKKFSADKWKAFAPCMINKNGRREFVTRETVEDQLWNWRVYRAKAKWGWTHICNKNNCTINAE